MRLADLIQKIKDSPDLPKDVFVFCAICSLGLGALLLGRILSNEASRKAELQIVQMSPLSIRAEEGIATSTRGTLGGAYVGSRNGTTYYLPWCGGVKLIHEENKIWFRSKEEATAKGYRPAGNCKGI